MGSYLSVVLCGDGHWSVLLLPLHDVTAYSLSLIKTSQNSTGPIG